MTTVLQGLLALTILILFVAGVTGTVLYGMRSRKKRFEQREELTPAEWFSRFFESPASVPRDLEKLLIALGEDLEVAWTRVRPDDTFSGTLALPSCAGDTDLVAFDSQLESWLADRGEIARKMFGPALPDRLGDLLLVLVQIDTACEGERRTA